MNPYIETNFFTFFTTLFWRIFDFPTQLASDEVQLLTLIAVSLSCALTGVWLTLRKMTMLANALSHTVLLGIVLAFLVYKSFYPINLDATFALPFSYLFIAALFVAVVTTYLTQVLNKKGRLQEEASIGIVFTTLFALGVLIVNLTARNACIGIEAVMGNVDVLSKNDLSIVYPIFLINLAAILLFSKELLISTFDEAFAKALGFKTNLITYGLMALVSLTIISSFKAVGVIMVLSFLTIPAVISRLYTHSIKKMLFLSCLIGVGSSLIGVALSRHILTEFGVPLSTGSLIVTLLSLFALGSLLFYKFKNRRLLQTGE